MKKQLLTTLLTFTVIPSFAAQPSNTELLAYLKQIKLDIQQNLQTTDRYEQELKKKWGNKDYIRAKKTWGNIYSFFKKENKNSKFSTGL